MPPRCCDGDCRRYYRAKSKLDFSPMPVEAPEVIEVDETRVACDGGGGALGHPRVYLEMGERNFVECPYCDRRFVLRKGAHPH
jgi:uncharacterized Zn-finger protein